VEAGVHARVRDNIDHDLVAGVLERSTGCVRCASPALPRLLLTRPRGGTEVVCLWCVKVPREVPDVLGFMTDDEPTALQVEFALRVGDHAAAGRLLPCKHAYRSQAPEWFQAWN
jgi:hypothetical protein